MSQTKKDILIFLSIWTIPKSNNHSSSLRKYKMLSSKWVLLQILFLHPKFSRAINENKCIYLYFWGHQIKLVQWNAIVSIVLQTIGCCCNLHLRKRDNLLRQRYCISVSSWLQLLQRLSPKLIAEWSLKIPQTRPRVGHNQGRHMTKGSLLASALLSYVCNNTAPSVRALNTVHTPLLGYNDAPCM